MNKTKLSIEKEGLFLNEKPFFLASGDMHYFRFFNKEGWRRRLQLMKDFGLSAVQTYVPWNLHEPEKGEFHFEGNLDLAAFLQLCQEIGLYVMLRPSVYICSEWEFGGMPYWLKKEKNLCPRTSDPRFMAHMRSYYERLSKEFVPYLSTNGGPVIAVAVENEYGSFGDDAAYLQATGDLLQELGVDVPLFTAGGWEPMKLKNGGNPAYWNALDLHLLTPEAKASIDAYQPDKPIYIAECWGGRSQQWGGHLKRQTPEAVAEKYKNVMEAGAYVNLYMFCGGTNFGFMNGALVGRYGADIPGATNRYIPFCTSYDVDAPVSEAGVVSRKYMLCSRVLKTYLETHGFAEQAAAIREPQQNLKFQSIRDVKLTESCDLLENVERLAVKACSSALPLTFEDMDQAYGYMLYSSFIRYTDDQQRVLNIQGIHDRAIVFGNGHYLGTCMRDREFAPIAFTVPAEGLKLDILVENMGRVNYGNAMLHEYKGITEYVKVELVQPNGTIYPWNYTFKSNWINYSLPMKDLSSLDYTKPAQQDRPAFFKGAFRAVPGVDTYLSTKGWDKGVVWINGFNLGRYWKVGPQETLYVPGELLQENNTIEIFELHNPPADHTIQFTTEPSLDTVAQTTDLIESVVG